MQPVLILFTLVLPFVLSRPFGKNMIEISHNIVHRSPTVDISADNDSITSNVPMNVAAKVIAENPGSL
ncbi:unnamed protein product [Rhizopus stolonifer]